MCIHTRRTFTTFCRTSEYQPGHNLHTFRLLPFRHFSPRPFHPSLKERRTGENQQITHWHAIRGDENKLREHSGSQRGGRVTWWYVSSYDVTVRVKPHIEQSIRSWLSPGCRTVFISQDLTGTCLHTGHNDVQQLYRSKCLPQAEPVKRIIRKQLPLHRRSPSTWNRVSISNDEDFIFLFFWKTNPVIQHRLSVCNFQRSWSVLGSSGRLVGFS